MLFINYQIFFFKSNGRLLVECGISMMLSGKILLNRQKSWACTLPVKTNLSIILWVSVFYSSELPKRIRLIL